MLLEEFDPSLNAYINPDMNVSHINDFPKVVVSLFSKELFDKAVLELDCREIASIHSCNGHNPIYDVAFHDKHIGFYKSFVGAPMCAGDYEEVIAMGCKCLILLGNCGVLDGTIEDCGIIIPTMALRDEGTSYHYAPPSDIIEISKKYRNEFKSILKNHNLSYVEGMTWTTDAFYRETKDKIARRKAAGAICVEMECAAMQAVSDFRGVDFFQFLYAGDSLDGDEWDERSLSGRTRLNDKIKIVRLAFELAAKISE